MSPPFSSGFSVSATGRVSQTSWSQLCCSMVSRTSHVTGSRMLMIGDDAGMYPTRTEPSHGAASYYATTSRLARAYLKDILSNPESRKIFYFLMLNMGYMMVQMLYGIWTNSLGLISDGMSMYYYLLLRLSIASYPYGFRLHGDCCWLDCFRDGTVAAE